MFLTHIPSKTHGIFIKTPIPAGNLTRQEFFSLYKDQKYYFSTCIFSKENMILKKILLYKKDRTGCWKAQPRPAFMHFFNTFFSADSFSENWEESCEKEKVELKIKIC